MVSIVLTALTLIWVSVIDLRSHRIPHYFLLILFAIQALAGFPIRNFEFIFPSFVVGIIAFYLSGVGGGDIKLMWILLIFAIPKYHIHQFLLSCLLFCPVLIVGIYLKQRTWRCSVPLAPAISAGYVASALLG